MFVLLRFYAIPWHHRWMGEIVNLRRVKKTRARADAAVEAAVNRAKHGRTREERAAQMVVTARQDRVLDGALLDRNGEPTE
jgi:hypothetical protein